MNKNERENIIKKLLYKSCYRGCKETDLIIGEFAKDHLEQMSKTELSEFENILELSDGDIYDWYTQKKPIPAEVNSDMLQKLMQYEPKR